jgi:hypothetical protein
MGDDDSEKTFLTTVGSIIFSIFFLFGGIALLIKANDGDTFRLDDSIGNYAYAMTQLLGASLCYPAVHFILYYFHGGEGIFKFIYNLSAAAQFAGLIWCWIVLDADGDLMREHYYDVWACLIYITCVTGVCFAIIIFAACLFCCAHCRGERTRSSYV